MSNWSDELPLTQEEALEFADRWKRKRDKYPEKDINETYRETKIEMGFNNEQSRFMDVIIESFCEYMENKSAKKR